MWQKVVNTCLGEVGEGIEKYFSEEYFCQKEAVDSREEALDILCGLLEKNGMFLEGYRGLLQEREDMGSTEVGNGICLPHSPEPFFGSPLICILVSRIPFTWERGKVNLVIMLCMGKETVGENDRLNDCIANFSVQEKLMERFMAEPNYETMAALLRQCMEI